MNLHAIMAGIASLMEAAKTAPWSDFEAEAVLVLTEIETSPAVPPAMKVYLAGLVQAIQLIEPFTPAKAKATTKPIGA